MRKDFEDWLKVRDNCIDEGLWQGIKNKVAAPFNRIGQKINDFNNDPRAAHNLPRDAEDAANTLESKDRTITRFADALGLPPNMANNPTIRGALTNIAVARVYGEKYGIIEAHDLKILWDAMQRTKGGKTIASLMGITSPKGIINKVPLKVTNQRYSTRQPDVNEYEASVVRGLRQAAQAMPQGKSPGNPAPLNPATQQQKVVGAGSKKARRYVKNQISQLNAEVQAGNIDAAQAKLIIDQLTKLL